MGESTRESFLVEDIDRARGDFLASLAVTVHNGALRDPKLAHEVLKGQDPEQWGKKVRETRATIETHHTETVRVDLGALLDLTTLSDAELAIVEARLELEERRAAAITVQADEG